MMGGFFAPQPIWRLALRLGLSAIFLLLAVWSGARLTEGLQTDPSTRWPDYFVFIFPLLFLLLAGGLFHVAFARNARILHPPTGGFTLAFGSSSAVVAALYETTGGRALGVLVSGLIAAVLAYLLLRVFKESPANDVNVKSSRDDVNIKR